MGPVFTLAKVWSSLGIGHYPNFHDPGGSWWQGEPALHFFRRAIFKRLDFPSIGLEYIPLGLLGTDVGNLNSVPARHIRPRKNHIMPTPTSQKKYRLEWVGHDIPSTMRPGVVLPVTVTVKNTGDWLWPDKRRASPEKRDGTYAVRLSYRWAKADGQLLAENGARGDLTASIEPGTVANFIIKITPPTQPGKRQLQLDLVEELVTFFSAKGTKKLVWPVKVG